MHVDEFRTCQSQYATQNLVSLVMTCRHKFLKAAHLLEVRNDVIDKLTAFGIHARVDVAPLSGPFHVLAERYAEQFFTSQKSLFPLPGDAEDEKWDRYFYQILVPYLVTDAGTVRNILRAVHALPSHQPAQAVAALQQHFTELTLPTPSPILCSEDGRNC